MSVAVDTAIVILAGGNATRFPGKLERRIGGEPMLLCVYRHARATGWPVYIAGRGWNAAEIDAQLDAPVLVDRRPGDGPLQAFLSACDAIEAERIVALAADEPYVDARLLASIAAAWQPGDEAVAPEHDGRFEPLAALYVRSAARREAARLVEGGSRAMRALIGRLQTRFVAVPGRYFANINTPQDLHRAIGMSR
jgi:molybdopterin-guanine dinucleotide biosynthesis protein A